MRVLLEPTTGHETTVDSGNVSIHILIRPIEFTGLIASAVVENARVSEHRSPFADRLLVNGTKFPLIIIVAMTPFD